MKRFVFVLVPLLGVALDVSQVNRVSRLPMNKIDAISFLDENHGFVQQQSQPHPETFETLDGGKTWKRTEDGVPGFRRGRSFATRLKGWSIDEDLWNHGVISVTEDGGHTWYPSLDKHDKNEFVFGGIQAVSEREVWATGSRGTYHTTDGGKSWENKGPAGTGLQFLDAEHGWIEGDKLWHTDNGGKTWESIGGDRKSCFGGYGFFFLDDRHGWAVSGKTEGNMEGGAETGFITVTKDGGKTCEELPHVPGQFFWSVYFLNERAGWAGGIGLLLKTEDGGHTWVDVSDGKRIELPDGDKHLVSGRTD